MTPSRDGCTIWCTVDSSNLNKPERIGALNDDDLLQAAATVMDALRRRGLLFPALAAIVAWQDKMFLEENGVAS